MPKRSDIKKVLVIGSGPIIIGQGAEFDYSGTQACKVLMEEGIEVILLNNNPATIMTDLTMATKVYMEPLLPEIVEKILIAESPDSIIAGMGGQTALNLVMKLDEMGILSQYGVKVIGTSTHSIHQAESREAFKALMEAIGQPCVPSETVESIESAEAAAAAIGYPVVVRPAFTLGGTGGGIAENVNELRNIAAKGLGYAINGQILVEKCIKGWKEIEYEMMRDSAGNVITVCNMENVDPVGIHTGDSIVVAPSQTLSDQDYQMLRHASMRIVDALDIQGGCNVQIALEPNSKAYSIIEVNPRVSRSSALASKATGYPIAKVAAKIALGYALHEIVNDVTGVTTACFEPTLDYCVVKLPKFPFDKFHYADKSLGTMMMATGEVMAIGSSFEAAFMKALRSLESHQYTLRMEGAKVMVLKELFEAIEKPDDLRIFYVAELLWREVGSALIAEKTGMDLFFLKKLETLVNLEKSLCHRDFAHIEKEELRRLKVKGFSDLGISQLMINATEDSVREKRMAFGILPAYKMVDTCGAEFEAASPYYYSCYESSCEVTVSTAKKVLVLGSGPIRIGQGVEFDYCTVRGVSALKTLGYETIVINNNPETVSTDFNTSDQLFFEPVTKEDVLNLIDLLKPEGVIVQFGGQTALKLALDLENAGVKLLGTSAANLHRAEERDAFSQAAKAAGVLCPEGFAASSVSEALAIVEALDFPLMVRPSYVLGGLGMKIVRDEATALAYLENAFKLQGVKTVLIDRYLEGMECEVDGISDGEAILIPGIMSHLEGAGVHSGDSISVYPPVGVSETLQEKMVDYAARLAKELNIIGLFNIQYVIHKEEVYVLEVNPRSSRTNPFISKVTDTPLLDLATALMMGADLKSLGWGEGLLKPKSYYYFKLPVFSHAKIPNVDVRLGPEMKSTGELLSIDEDFLTGLYKGFLAVAPGISETKAIYADCSIQLMPQLEALLHKFKAQSKEIFEGVNWHLSEAFHSHLTACDSALAEDMVLSLSSKAESHIRKGNMPIVISLFESSEPEEASQKAIRRAAVENRGLCITNIDTLSYLFEILAASTKVSDLKVYAMGEV